MIIKIADIELDDWKQWRDVERLWFRLPTDYWHTKLGKCKYIGCIQSQKGWQISFAMFAELANVYWGPDTFDTLDEATQYVDNWLLKISKMEAFW